MAQSATLGSDRDRSLDPGLRSLTRWRQTHARPAAHYGAPMTITTESGHGYLAPKPMLMQDDDLTGVLRDCCLTTIDQAPIRGLDTA